MPFRLPNTNANTQVIPQSRTAWSRMLGFCLYNNHPFFTQAPPSPPPLPGSNCVDLLHLSLILSKWIIDLLFSQTITDHSTCPKSGTSFELFCLFIFLTREIFTKYPSLHALWLPVLPGIKFRTMIFTYQSKNSFALFRKSLAITSLSDQFAQWCLSGQLQTTRAPPDPINFLCCLQCLQLFTNALWWNLKTDLWCSSAAKWLPYVISTGYIEAFMENTRNCPLRILQH